MKTAVGTVILATLGLCQLAFATVSKLDRGFNKLVLGDSQTSSQLIPKPALERFLRSHPTPLEPMSLFNRQKSECLRLYISPGGEKAEFAKAKLTKGNSCREGTQTTFANFESDHQIRLGMTPEAVKRRLGTPTGDFEGQSKLKLIYKIESGEPGADFLTKLNLPSYQAQYIFDKGQLAEIELAFENP